MVCFSSGEKECSSRIEIKYGISLLLRVVQPVVDTLIHATMAILFIRLSILIFYFEKDVGNLRKRKHERYQQLNHSLRLV